MDDAEFDRVYKDLMADLHSTIEILNDSGETGWRDTLVDWGRQIKAGSRRGLEALLGSFGGMGSFNDLILSPINGHDIDGDGTWETAELDDLRGRLYDGVSALLRELDRSAAPHRPVATGRPGDRRTTRSTDLIGAARGADRGDGEPVAVISALVYGDAGGGTRDLVGVAGHGRRRFTPSSRASSQVRRVQVQVGMVGPAGIEPATERL